jgi:regulator of protease activity HflC (stomatin/prohibitin superfamily)
VGGISSILGTVAILGFVLFVAGIALAVVASSQGRKPGGGISLAIVGLIGGLLFSVLAQGIIIVEPTRVAVVINTLSGAVEEPRRGGTHVIVPVVQQVATDFPITQQEYTMSRTSDEGSRGGDDSIEARTNDGQTVNIDVTVIFNVNGERANDLYRTWGQNYVQGFVRPTSRSIVREVVANFSAEQIYGEARAQLGDDISSELRASFESQSLSLTELLVRDISFSEAFTESIEQKVVAEQNLERARTEAQTAQTRAQGEANAAIAAAEGRAQATILQAQAEAEALRLVSEQIAANPSLIQYQYVQNLSDNVQLMLVPSNSPFLFDFNQLAQSNPNFAAPAATPTTP